MDEFYEARKPKPFFPHYIDYQSWLDDDGPRRLADDLAREW